MPKVHTVKAARKAYPEAGINIGDTYYYWEFRFGGMHRSKTYPKPSQLTQSEFLSTVYSITEEMGDISAESCVGVDEDGVHISHEDLQSSIDDFVSRLEDLQSETQEKYDNMPEGLQQGQTGELLQSRADSVQEMIDALQSIDLSDAEGFEDECKEEDELPEEDVVVEGVPEEQVAEAVAEVKADNAAEKTEARKQRAIEIVQAIVDEIQCISYDGE